MATNRSYNDLCGLAHALDLIGERWALLVVRELVLGGRRYTDLRSELPGISSNVLSHRLDELVKHGLVTRRTLPPPAASTVYELTDWGDELEPIVLGLAHWGARSPGHPSGDHLSASSLILSLRTNFIASSAGDTDIRIRILMRGEPFRVSITGGDLTAERASLADDPEQAATVDAEPMTLAKLLYGGEELDQLISTDALRLHGDRHAFEAMLSLFSLPATAAVPPQHPEAT